MTRKAELILPSGAMPWGRWVTDLSDNTLRQIEQVASDPDSPSNQFRNQADKLATQISKIQVSTIRELTLPGFSEVVSGSLGTSRNVVSPVYNFSAPSASSVSVLGIVNFRMTASGSASYQPMIKINGKQFNDQGASPMRPPTDSSQGRYSVTGQVSIGSTGSISVQYGVRQAVVPTANTLTFDAATVWLAFYGGIDG